MQPTMSAIDSDGIKGRKTFRVHLFLLVVWIIGSFGVTIGQHSARMNNRLKVAHINGDFGISDLDNKRWDHAESVSIETYWSGEAAPKSRHTAARLLWSDKALYVRFDARQEEPLVVSDHPDLSKKTIGLWDRDVSEIFIAPDPSAPNKYFEFEVAPTGEWVDLGIEVRPEKRVTDWEYKSGMTAAARIEKNRVFSAIRIEWKAFGKTPQAGDRWRGNLFRCVGKDPDRGYVTWQPTLTKEPAFHVPDKFGWFEFIG